ncbi:MAG: glycosyltransferase family 4 protein [Chloroflexi bacterium]|nr:glycosyltransferase family 4 protein [Chloroflexota bacterium]
MKIALVSPYDFAYPGGVVNHISSLERQFTRMGHEVRIIAPASKAVAAYGEQFIPVGKPRPLPVNGSIARITLSPWLASRVQDIFERERFDICHLHEPLMPMLCTTTLRLCQVPAVGTFHASGGKPWYSFWTPVGKHFLKKWFHRLDARIAVSKPAGDFVSRYFPAEYLIIPNGIDTRHFAPETAPPLPEFSDGKQNILFVGRLEPRKGFNYLLEAYKRIKEQNPATRLIVIGPGTRLRHRYENRVAETGLKDVVFLGYVSYDDLPRYYNMADVVCSPAIGSESFGIVLLEAMAMGKPLVASNIDGYRSVLTDGHEGLLAPPRNIDRLADALLSLLGNADLRHSMGARGRLTARNYDWQHVAARVMEVYERTLRQPRRREASREKAAMMA